ncbi:MAG: hypothetical protein ACT4OM_00745 [Actinomycetota bacterium]
MNTKDGLLGALLSAKTAERFQEILTDFPEALSPEFRVELSKRFRQMGVPEEFASALAHLLKQCAVFGAPFVLSTVDPDAELHQLVSQLVPEVSNLVYAVLREDFRGFHQGVSEIRSLGPIQEAAKFAKAQSAFHLHKLLIDIEDTVHRMRPDLR